MLIHYPSYNAHNNMHQKLTHLFALAYHQLVQLAMLTRQDSWYSKGCLHPVCHLRWMLSEIF